MDTLWLLGGMALVTFGLRYGLLPHAGRITLTPGMRRALRFVPPAVLTAIIVPAALMPDGQTLALTWRNPYLMGALATLAIGKLSRNLLVTLVGGMAFFSLWKWAL
jgi:branched-subunit amino acid transport protein